MPAKRGRCAACRCWRTIYYPGGMCSPCGLGERPRCQHCHERYANRPRQLCWSCYYRPGVRDLYPSTSKYCRRGVADRGATGLPAEPTTLPPGPRKVPVLEERAAAGASLFHPDDAPPRQRSLVCSGHHKGEESLPPRQPRVHRYHGPREYIDLVNATIDPR